MNVDSFIKEWWSGSSLDYRHEIREWMKDSYIQPISFWQDLFAQSPKTSIIMEKYDFYSDCILTHVGKGLKAFITGKVTWTYDQINQLIEIQSYVWKSQYNELAPGQTVALFLPYGIEYIVALLTALKLGLIVSIIPRDDRFFGKKSLEEAFDQVKPDLVITQAQNTFPGEWKRVDIDITLEKSTKGVTSSHIYSPADTVQKHYHPKGVIEVEATRSYLNPLRDGLITLQLKLKSRFARPAFSMFLEEPSGTLMALLSGAEIVYVPEDQLTTLKESTIDVIGIPSHLLYTFIRTPLLASCKLKLWFRNPLYGNDHSWRAFSQINQIQKIPSCQVIFDKEQGGITLFSQPKPIDTLTFLHPSLGSPWKLLKIVGKGDASIEGFGLFAPEPTEKPPHLIISQVGDEWCISGSVAHLKEGQSYPTELVQESAKKLDFVQTCLVIPERHPEHFHNQQFILIVFVSPQMHHVIEQKKLEWRRSLQDQIGTDVGLAFVPDHTLFYSMYPKLVKGEPSRHWIEKLHKNGALAFKQKRSIYHTLNLIKQSIYEILAYSTSQT